jgi:protein-tyrosine phosphatase
VISLIDIHQHLLYGLDDGPLEKSEMEQMLLIARDNRVETIVATPHITPGIVPFSAEKMEQRIAEARQICSDRGLAVEVLAGAEMMYTFHSSRYLTQRRVPTLAGTNKVLLEFSQDIGFAGIEQAVQTVLRNGYVPVLAHIERYPCLMRRCKRTARLRKEYEVRFQINQSVFLKSQNIFVHYTLQRLLAEGRIDYVASDAHDAGKRACRLQEAYERLASAVGVSYADRLTGNGMTVQEMLSR